MGSITRSFANLITASGPSGLPAGVAGINTPAFYANLTGHITANNNTLTKITFNQTQFDTDSDFDTSVNNRFVPSVAGKYFLHFQVKYDINTNTEVVQASIAKNGTDIFLHYRRHTYDTVNQQQTIAVGGIVTANGSTDYFEGNFFQNSGGSITVRLEKTGTYFQGYKIIE